jgi:phage regulator Rha-like protein
VKNNIDRFAEDFRFQLNEDEMQNLMCKKCTSSWGGTRKLPYAFTEQGIYMLMTVLKGDLAIRQSMALIRLFKQMKDCIVENQQLIGVDELPKELLESIVGHIEFMSQHQDQAAANREAT